jgi:hypothetical protein
MKSPLLRALILAVAVVPGVPQEVDACSCVVAAPPCAAAWSAQAVFVGTVRAIDTVPYDADGRPYESKLVTIDVGRGLLRTAPGTVQVMTAGSGASCGFAFEVGRTYLVYASSSNAGAQLEVTNCSRTRQVETAQEDLRYLQHLPDPAHGARVYGRVTFLHRDAFWHEPIDYGPLSDVSVLVRGAGFLREAVTNADGRFEVGGLPIGHVTVSVNAPHGADPRMTVRDLHLEDPRGCGQADFELYYSATASGRLVDASGHPAARIKVEAVDFELAGHGPPHGLSAWTDANGRFTFDDLPPGRYVFGIGLTRVPYVRPQPAQREVYLPGTLDVREARIVDIKAGDELALGEFRLPH